MKFLSIQRRVAALTAVCFCFFNANGQHKLVRPHPSSTLSFIKNLGQWQEPFLYKINIPGGAMFLGKNGITSNFISRESADALHKQAHNYFTEDAARDVVANYHAFRMSFKHGNEDVHISEEEKQETYHNYYTGNKPALWKSKVPLFNKLVYNNIYSGISYEIFTANNTLKYNFIIQPGANYKKIIMHYEGCKLQPDNGRLKIKTSVNEILEAEPYAYQVINDIIVKVPCWFVINGNDVGFQTTDFNPNYPLIIDPIIVFATYSGSTVDNFGFTAAFDSEENLYCAGITEKNGYPTTLGAYQKTMQGGSNRYLFIGVDNPPIGWDVSISKYDSSGTKLRFATYLGGNDNEYPHSLLVDYSDNLVVLGSTFSKNFPHSINAFDSTLNDGSINGKTDIFITKFDSGGTFLASTFVGGNRFDGVSNNAATIPGGNSSLVYNYADEFRGDVIADKNNNYYIGSITESADFPLKNQIQNTLKGAFDGIVFKIDSNLANIFWSTYIGGDGEDGVYSIDLDKANEIYISGGTTSSNFPVSSNAYSKTFGGVIDGFISKLSNDGQTLLASSYLGTTNKDQVYFVEIDKNGNIFATGQTEGVFPVSPGVYSKTNGSQFVVKLDPDLKTLLLSTVFGTGRLIAGHPNPDISPTAFLVDNCDLIYVCGWGSDLGLDHGGGTKDLLVASTTPPIYTTTDGNDFYIIVFDKDFSGVKFNTYMGENGDKDHVDGGTNRFDKRGIIYASVCSSCDNGPTGTFPTQPPTVKFPNNFSPRCSNASFKLDFQLQTSIIAAFRPTPRIACAPQLISMNSKNKAVRYQWDFGDGTTDTVQDPQHLYTKPGVYKIRLVCEDTNTCNRFDTVYDEVTLLDESKADFKIEVFFCDSRVDFINKSKNQITYLWDFGDGTLDSTTINPKHKYSESGKFTATLYINKGFPCSDSMVQIIDFNLFKPKGPVIPNVFTPNGDGQNDSFAIGGLNPKCDKVEMKIYNRWGELIFETKEIGNWWGGKNKNTDLPEGIYYYTLKVTNYKGEVTERKGDVTVIR